MLSVLHSLSCPYPLIPTTNSARSLHSCARQAPVYNLLSHVQICQQTVDIWCGGPLNRKRHTPEGTSHRFVTVVAESCKPKKLKLFLNLTYVCCPGLNNTAWSCLFASCHICCLVLLAWFSRRHWKLGHFREATVHIMYDSMWCKHGSRNWREALVLAYYICTEWVCNMLSY